MHILYDAYTDLQMKMSAQPVLCAFTVIKNDDVNMFDIVDASATALLVLAKEYQNQLIMKDLDCIGFFVQMFYSNNALIQKAAASLLAELASYRPTSAYQYGQLKSVDELVASMPQHLAARVHVLKHVTTKLLYY